MPSYSEVAVRDLLNDSRWIHSIAKSLVANPTEAEDLAQEAAVAALQRPPTRPGNIRGWVQTVMRNALRQSKRGDVRRTRREATVARAQTQTLEAPDRAFERTTLRKQVAEEALALAEPYRTPVLFRFFEEMTPNEISSELQIPVATVHTQLRRGLEMLRKRLDQVCADGTDWRALLVHTPRLPLLPKLFIPTILIASVGFGALALLGDEGVPGSGAGAASSALSETKTPKETGLVPSGDPQLDELRRLAVRAPLDELVSKRGVLTSFVLEAYRNDEFLWHGLERLTKATLRRHPMDDRRPFALWLAAYIEQSGHERAKHLLKYTPLLRKVR